MPVFETISLTLGAAIAKQIIKSWLGDGVVSNLSGELVDLLKGKTESTLAQREVACRIEKIGEQVATKLRPVFEAESLKLGASEIAVVTQEVALTLAKTPIDARLVLDYRFDAERLARHLVNLRPNVVQTFSAAETALYERFLRELCKEIVEIASELSSFERHFSEATLQNQDQVLELVEKILSRPTKESAAFERLYCKTIIGQLDRMELFGVTRMDSATKRQSLSIAYVAIDVDQLGNRDRQTQLLDSVIDDPLTTAELYAKEAARCVKTLAMIGSNRALKVIIEYAGDDRFEVKKEIEQAWGQFDRHKYAQEVLVRSQNLWLENHSTWEGFEHLSHLEGLHFWNSQLTDLRPIQYLPNLKFLELIAWKQLSDLSPLIHVQNLKRLSIQNCKNISALNPLVNLKGLNNLLLHNCPQIRDLAPLTRLAKLTRLVISSLPEVDLSPIAILQNLTSLDVWNIPISDTRIFEGLTKLKRLTLDGAKISSLDFLSALTELTEVGIKDEKVTDLRILSTLPKLTSVSVSDLGLITHLTHLKEINIGGTKISDLEPLTAFAALERLFISGTEVTDLSPLADLTNLTFMNAGRTKIIDLSPLKNLSKLKFLIINNTNVTDLSPLANLTSLERLDISGTPVKDLSPVKGIKGLKIIR